MSAQVYPPISPSELIRKEEESLAAELQWLLARLQEEFSSLKNGLLECIELLAPKEPGSILALSSLRSESVKGIVTRIGTRIVKGDIQLRLSTLPVPRNQQSYPLHIQDPILLPQLSHLLTELNQALDIIDISCWTGDPRNGPFILGQLKLLHETIEEARRTIKSSDGVPGAKWFEGASDEDLYSPALPATLAPHLSIADGALVFHARTLSHVGNNHNANSGTSTPNRSNGGNGEGSGTATPTTSLAVPDLTSWTGLSIRSRLGLTARLPVHDELEQTFTYRGEEVQVREKVRVESQDPSLMAVMAKLSALEHEVVAWRVKVGIVMGETDNDDNDDDDGDEDDRADQIERR